MSHLSTTNMTCCWNTKEELLELFTGRVERDVIDLLIQNRDKNLFLAYQDLIEITKISDLEKTLHYSSNDKQNCSTDTDSIIISNSINWERLSTNESPTNRILYLVSSGYKVLVLMRGCPGSGKSYNATNILNCCYNNVNNDDFIFGADKFFTNKYTGAYNFNFNKLSTAHQWAYSKVERAIQCEVTPVIIDNTNTECWEMEKYVKLGVINGYWIEIVEPISEWAWDEQKLFEKNSHNVPFDVIKKMLDRYEHNITVDLLLTKFNLKYYKKNTPPKLSNNFKKYQVRENLIDERKIKKNPKINDLHNDDFKDLCISQKYTNNEINQCAIFNSSDDKPMVECSMQERGAFHQFSEFQIPPYDIPDLNEECQSISSIEDQEASNYINKSVNTYEDDFLFMGILNEIPKEEYSSNVIFGTNRDINEDNQCVLNFSIGKLDKGTTTNDLIKNIYKPNFNELSKHFPEHVCSLITELFDKCQGDLEWIVSMLVESGHNISKQQLQNAIQFDNVEEVDKTIIDAIDYRKKKPGRKIVDLKEKKLLTMSNNLKKDIENKFVFGDSLYSDHVLKIKKSKEDNQNIMDNDNAIMRLISENVEEDLMLKKNDEGKCVQLVMDTSVLIQLCDYFGDNSSDLDKNNFSMSVKLPEKLAEDLYYYLIANAPDQEFRNREAILKDEIFAKKLQEECDKKNPSRDISNCFSNEYSFSAVLSKKLLLEKFKNLDSKLVLHVFRAKEYKFQDTCDYLSKISGVKCSKNEDSPRIEENKEINEVKNESNSNSNQNYSQETFNFAHLKQQYLNKANYSLNKHYPSVTQHYLEKAEENRINEQYAKTKALEEMVKQNDNFTLDLHYLPVQEAIQVLDLYLDNQISILKKCTGGYTKGRQLTIVTGRGKHSPKGIARIKPVVVRRLQERQLVHLEPEKPGYVMVIIKKNSLLGSEFN